MSARDTALRAAEYALSRKAEDVLVLEVRGLSSVTDYVVICSGLSDTQVRSIAEGARRGLRADGVRCMHQEGEKYANWVVLDFVDVVVHVMQPEVRIYYNLEGLWADAPHRRYGEADHPAEDLDGEWASKDIQGGVVAGE